MRHLLAAASRASPLLVMTLIAARQPAQEALAQPAASADEIVQVPDDLRELVFGARKQPKMALRIEDVAYTAIPAMARRPALLWPNRRGEGPAFARDAATAWLLRAGETLRLAGFEPRFAAAARWHDLDVLEFDLVRDGLRLLDAKVALHFEGGRFAGLSSTMPGPITGSDAPPADATGRVWYAEPNGQGYRLVVARLVDEELPQRTVTSVVTARGVAYRISTQHPTAAPSGVPTFSEHQVPSGTFPDQIWSDSTGLIWFSQPSNNWVTSFDPLAKTFKQYPTTGGTGPDGLWVDDKDRVWTGLYYTGGLGVLDVPTKAFTANAAPYSPVAMAIPSPSADGGVWVTDHQYNRISEWDPTGKKWAQSLVMPTAGTWVVQGTLDPGRGVVYFTGYTSNTLPMKTRTGPIVDIPVPSRGGPAFLAFHDDKVWFSLWSNNRLGEYDVVSKQITEYAYTAGETGGPMSIGPNGRPVVGTKNAGYIEVFDPVSKTFGHYKIPSSTGLKDGLCVAPDGAIWFTGTYTNKIARLEVQ